MTSEEWTEGVWRVTGRQGKGGEVETCFLIDCGDELALVETGQGEKMGRAVLQTIAGVGRSTSELTHIFLTHSHPYVLGGLGTIVAAVPDVKVMVQEAAKPVFEEGKSYVMEKQFPLGSKGGKLALAWKTDVFANYDTLKSIEPTFVGLSDDVQVGDETFILQGTGGHSADSLLIHAYQRKSTFVGDELGLYDHNEYSFYCDLTGKPENRVKALRMCSKLNTNYVFPTHLSPVERGFLDEEVEQAILAQQHFETTLLETLMGYDNARLDRLVDHVYQVLHVDWKSPFDALQVGTATITQFLEGLVRQDKVLYDEKTKRYKFNREELDPEYDPYAGIYDV